MHKKNDLDLRHLRVEVELELELEVGIRLANQSSQPPRFKKVAGWRIYSGWAKS